MNTQGKWIGIGVARDISERKQVETELAAHRNQLELLVISRTRDLMIAKEAAEAGWQEMLAWFKAHGVA